MNFSQKLYPHIWNKAIRSHPADHILVQVTRRLSSSFSPHPEVSKRLAWLKSLHLIPSLYSLWKLEPFVWAGPSFSSLPFLLPLRPFAQVTTRWKATLNWIFLKSIIKTSYIVFVEAHPHAEAKLIKDGYYNIAVAGSNCPGMILLYYQSALKDVTRVIDAIFCISLSMIFGVGSSLCPLL